MNIPIRTAVAIHGDFWANALDLHDPRGHRNQLSAAERSAMRDFLNMRCAVRMDCAPAAKLAIFGRPGDSQ